MQDRLLNAFLSGTLEEAVYTAKTNKLKIEVVKANEALDGLGDVDRLRGDRGQKRRHIYLPDVAGFAQPCGQVNNPLHAGGAHIRTLEWKRMMPAEFASRIRGTVLTTETPFTPDNPAEFEYPFPDDFNARRYEEYRRRAAALDGTLICGRLGEYKYFDMDQAIGRALSLAQRMLDA